MNVWTQCKVPDQDTSIPIVAHQESLYSEMAPLFSIHVLVSASSFVHYLGVYLILAVPASMLIV